MRPMRWGNRYPVRLTPPRAIDVAIDVAIVTLTLLTAYIHSTLGGLLFLANAAGFTVLAVAMVAPIGLAVRYRGLVRVGLGAFSAATIGSWVLFGARYSTGYLATGIEIALLALVAVATYRRYGGFVAIARLVAEQLARLTRFASRLIAALILLAVALAACGSGSGAPGTSPAASADPDAPTIVARGNAFTTKELTVPAGKAFSLVFENQDGVPHNVTIFAEGADPVFVGDIFSGPATRSYAVPALAAGRYRFRCDIHLEMTGTLIVE